MQPSLNAFPLHLLISIFFIEYEVMKCFENEVILYVWNLNYQLVVADHLMSESFSHLFKRFIQTADSFGHWIIH